jgi:hypothetical protein
MNSPSSPLILYQTEDGRTRIECRCDDDSLWLTQAQMAELFATTPQNVTLHLKAIDAERELDEAATCKEYLQVRSEGTREVSRSLRHYRLEAILAVGFRVRFPRGTQFRHWATARLTDALHRNKRVLLPGVGGTVSRSRQQYTVADLRAFRPLVARHPDRKTPRHSRPESARAA